MSAEKRADRDRLVEEHLGLVHHVAGQMYRIYAIHADFDELVSAGTMGLMGAIESFEPERGVAFSSFATPRIRGAIQDELRRMDHVPRSLRRKTRDIAKAKDDLMRVLGRMPESAEIAEHLGIDLATLHRWESESESVNRVSLSGSGSDRQPKGRPMDLIETLSNGSGETEDDRLNFGEEVEFLREAIERLKDREKTVLSLYYFEELKLHQIATVLDLTESRVSQIRSKALSKLRADLAGLRV